MTTRTTRRRGFTLIEVMLVLAVLILLAAVLLPSISVFRGDSRPQAAVDSIRGELAIARGRAMIENRPYRIAIDETKTRIRRAPDGPDFATTPAADHADGGSTAVEYGLEHATAEILSDASVAPAIEGGWQTVAVVLPAGSCLDDAMTVRVQDRDNSQSVLRVQIRGLTATARVVANTPETGK